MLLKDSIRFLVNKVLLRSLPRPFRHDDGFCWTVPLQGLSRHADDPDHPGRSTLALYEDGLPLKPAHARHRDVRTVGLGRFCHWEDRLLFSTSDNSDPSTNGREYTYSVSPWLYKRRVDRPEIDPRVPVNHRKRDVTPEMIRSDVAFTLQVGNVYLTAMRQFSPSLAGRSVLEVGPGINFGCVLLLACYGARPLVADRYLAPCDPGYHPRFYALLRDELRKRDPDVDVAPLTAILNSGGYPDAVLTRYESPLEEIAAPENSIDFVFSNAVIEHLYDLKAAFSRLHRITRPGGWGLHQVDFRDHRNFDRPLEYLLMSEEEFQEEYARCHGECGNRYRPDEATAQIQDAGFDVVDFQGNVFSRPEYVREFLPRLRAAGMSRYRGLHEADLHVLSGFYRLRKRE
jgi:SAM-dependent methyltransferase